MLRLWSGLQEEFHKTCKSSPESTDFTCHMYTNLYTSLSYFVKNIRENFDNIEPEAKSKLLDVPFGLIEFLPIPSYSLYENPWIFKHYEKLPELTPCVNKMTWQFFLQISNRSFAR